MKKYLLLFVFSFVVANTNAQMFHENFDSPSLDDSVTTIFNGPHGFAINSRIQVSPNNCDTAFINTGDTIILETNTFDASGITNLYLTFSHICKVDFFDAAVVEVSPDNGLTWFTLSCSEYLGSSAGFCAQGSQFSCASYADWFPANSAAIPDNGWWKKEIFDVSPFLAGMVAAKIRFRLFDSNIPGGNNNSGWYIDNIMVDTIAFGGPHLYLFGIDPCGLPETVNFNVGAPAFGYSANDTLNVHIFFGDGTDSIFNLSCQPTGFSAAFNHVYTMPGAYSVQGIFYSAIGISDTITYYNYIILSDTCGNVEGKMYIDSNTDCIFNAGDEPLRYKSLYLLYSGQFYRAAYSDTGGNYKFPNVPLNTYDLIRDTNQANFANLSILCPASGQYSITIVPSTGNDFAFECSAGFDLSTYISVWRVRPNVSACIYPVFSAITCSNMGGQAIFILDPLITYISANPVPDAINGDTLTWNFLSINLNNPFVPQVCIMPDSSLAIGDTVCFTSIIEPVAGDAYPVNNISYDCAEINNSCDPNNKSSFPDGNISPSQELNYIINFQNTGNDTAYNVFILDTIYANLDFNTLRINSASHNMTIDVLAGDVLKFNFNNIMLPDSGVNEPSSHGFVSYSIRPKSNLANGTQITNTAGIYFDFNLPVVTNTTLNIIDSTLVTGIWQYPVSGSEFSVFPNPATDFIIINSAESENKKYEIIISDVLGKQCLQTPNSQLPTKISISNFQNGIYFISMRQNGNSIKNMKLVKY